jgi:hypothetical protein
MQVFMTASKQSQDGTKFILSQNSTCFGHLLCPSSGVLYCTFGTVKFHAGFDDHFQAESGWNLIYSVIKLYMFRASSFAQKKMPETRRVL